MCYKPDAAVFSPMSSAEFVATILSDELGSSSAETEVEIN